MKMVFWRFANDQRSLINDAEKKKMNEREMECDKELMN